jgi:tRNA splicing ligase
LKKFDKTAIWRAVNSEYGDRLVEIAREHAELTKELITHKHGVDAEIIEARIVQLREERDGILELFENEEEASLNGGDSHE